MRQYGTCVAQPVDMGPRVAARLINGAAFGVLYVPMMLANDTTLVFLVLAAMLGLAAGQFFMILKKSTTIGGHAMKIVYLRVDSGEEGTGRLLGRMLLTDFVSGLTFGLANIALLVTYRDGQHWLDRAMGTVGVLRDTVSRPDALPAGGPFAHAPWQQASGQAHPARPTQAGVTPVSMPAAAPDPAVWPPAPPAAPAWPPAPADAPVWPPAPADPPVWPPAPKPAAAEPAPWSPFTSGEAPTADANPFARPSSPTAPPTPPPAPAAPVAAEPPPTSAAPAPEAANPWSLGSAESPRPPAASVPVPPVPAVPFGPPGQAPLPPRAEEPVAPPAPPVAGAGVLDDATVLDADVAPAPSVVLDDGDVITLETPVVLGRNPIAPADQPDARCVSLVDESKRMSKTHLVLRATDDGVAVVDVGASNGVGVEVDGVVERLTPHEPRLLTADAVVHLGSRTLRVSA